MLSDMLHQALVLKHPSPQGYELNQIFELLCEHDPYIQDFHFAWADKEWRTRASFAQLA